MTSQEPVSKGRTFFLPFKKTMQAKLSFPPIKQNSPNKQTNCHFGFVTLISKFSIKEKC